MYAGHDDCISMYHGYDWAEAHVYHNREYFQVKVRKAKNTQHRIATQNVLTKALEKAVHTLVLLSQYEKLPKT